MKKYLIIIFSGILFTLNSCHDFFESDSTNVSITKGDTIGTEREALYAMSGILQHLQVIGDNWVIANELRGDLLAVTHNSSQDLWDIYNFEVEPTNSYLNDREFYALVNDCNYLIKYVDTTKIVQDEKILKRYMSATKSIRAWAYMQMAMIYGQVYYSTEPILDATQDMSKLPKISMDVLVDFLLDDLSPLKPVDNTIEHFPGYFGENTEDYFIPIRLVLGDLYLWKKDYYNAALMYYQLILTKRLVLSSSFQNKWKDNQFLEYGTLTWRQLFLNSGEVVSKIRHTDDYAESVTILSKIFSPEYYWLAPSLTAISNWESQTYVETATRTTAGDLRGRINSSGPNKNAGSYYSDNLGSSTIEEILYPVVSKYEFNNNTTYLCRASQVYLKYAEAVNRLGKHYLALAVLKKGLNRESLTSLVSQSELAGNEPFLDFGQNTPYLADLFSANKGIQERGCGNVGLLSTSIPTGVDTLIWVEDQIIMEAALENAFEGNRFVDLMRVANHRDDPLYLAKMVASKFPPGQKEAMEQKLSDKENWFFPESEMKNQ